LIDAGAEQCYVKLLFQEDILLICQDYKRTDMVMQRKYLERSIKATDRKPLKIEYIPIYKLGVNYDMKNKVDGYWYSYDWGNRARYK
jgi:hypothetical protein